MRRLLAIGVLLSAACSSARPTATSHASIDADPIAHLRAFESTARHDAKFVETKAQDRAFGADPYDLAVLPDGRVAGILRGRDVLVVFDSKDTKHKELVHFPAPRSPSAIAVYDGANAGALRTGDILVASEIEPAIAHYRLTPPGQSIERLADIAIDGAYGVRDIATGPEGSIYVVEEHDDRLIELHGNKRVDHALHGPMRIARTRHALFVMSVLDHSITPVALDDHGKVVRVKAGTRMDGPFWGLDAIDVGTEDAIIIAGGVEDHPLDRRGGFFGYVDSFVYAFRFSAQAEDPITRTASINVSELGLILPKGIAFAKTSPMSPGSRQALVTSYGGDKALRLIWKQGAGGPPSLEEAPFETTPGTSALVATQDDSFIAANPLIDSWVTIDKFNRTHSTRVAVSDDARTDREKLGEALFFTSLMAPVSSSEGSKSRFTCETCHFEGYVDGRIHHTGRADIRAATKPLVGLFNNRPHFSRALDPDLSSVAENEFRVAGSPSSADPHFDLDVKDVPWIADLAIAPRRYDAAELRLSLMAFLMSFSHRTNPRSASLRSFNDQERAGATAFRDNCEMCHEARTAADDPASRVPFEKWESLIAGGNSPIVWASDAYKRTGIVPYVHEKGARVTSLRRIYKKKPYFTNGRGYSMMDVLNLATVITPVKGFMHAEGAGESLDITTMRALAAFIDLL